MLIYFNKQNTENYQIFPAPSDLENWAVIEVENTEILLTKTLVKIDDNNYKLVDKPPSEFYQFKDGEWVLDEEKQKAALLILIKNLSNNIDEVASQIAKQWTRFSDEYYEREEAAKAFAKANFEGEPSVWITGFAQPAGLDNKTATQLILKQAEQLKSMLASLGALRMRKYELKAPNLTQEQLQAKHDEIIEAMKKLAEAVA